MNHTIYLFNPEHDLALANNDPHFNAPLQAKKLARDMAYLPLWYASSDSCVLVPSISPTWQEEMRQLFPQLRTTFSSATSNLSSFSTIVPWGWDNTILKKLRLLGIQEEALPDKIKLKKIRQLSHRSTTIKALKFLQQNGIPATQLPETAQELKSVTEVIKFAAENPQAIFKAPWSGSGKGLCWSRDEMTESRLGWCRNIIEKQGCVMAEPIYNKRLDFAMEFTCIDQTAKFSGYSLFETERGVYRSNFLASNSIIIQKITAAGIHSEYLDTAQKCLEEFIATEIAPYYSGMLGIDMFIYEENGQRKLHPCVEINLRMTMGCVARIFFDRFVTSDATGNFYIDHHPNAGSLWKDHLERQASNPLKISNGLITQGYLSLTDINPHTHYRARIEIKRNTQELTDKNI